MSATGDVRRPREPSANGFTLIEMLVTLGIAALVVGILFPAVQRSLDYWNQRAAVASVRSALTEARSLAMRTSHPVRFALAARGDGFFVGAGAMVSLPSSAHMVGSISTLTFYPDGSANAGRFAIHTGARQSLLIVSPTTGLTNFGQ